MRDVYVISSCRTAVGTFGGSLRDVPAADLGATVIAEALKRGNVKGEWLDEVMFGNVLSAAQATTHRAILKSTQKTTNSDLINKGNSTAFHGGVLCLVSN